MAASKVFARDIALYMANQGFAEAMKKYEIKPPRARDVMEAMIKVGVDVPKELVELASQVRDYGHRQPPPAVGEERIYTSTDSSRVSVNGAVIGIGPKSQAKVKYEVDRIIITKPLDKKAK